MQEEEKVEREVDDEDVGHPRGTLLIMLLFLMMIVGLWGYIYLLMLERGL